MRKQIKKHLMPENMQINTGHEVTNNKTCPAHSQHLKYSPKTECTEARTF